MINSIIFYTKLLFIQADDIEQVSFQLLLLHVFAHSHTEMEHRIMFQKDAYLSSNVDVLLTGHQPSFVLIYELNHILASWLCLRRFVRITQGDAVEQFVILGECHTVEVRLG